MPVVRMVLEAATRQPTRRGADSAGDAAASGRERRRCCAWSRRSAADVLAQLLHPRRRWPERRPWAGRWCGASAPSCRAPDSAPSTHAMRHVARVGRPVGGSGAMPEAVLAAYLAAGGTLRHRAQGHGDPMRGRCRARRDDRRTAPTVDGAGRRVGLRPAPDVPRVAPRSAGRAAGTIDRWRGAAAGRRVRVEDRRRRSAAPPVITGDRRPDRGDHARSLRRWPRSTAGTRDARRTSPRPPGIAASTCRPCIDPTMAPAEHPDHHVLSLEVLYTPYRLHGRLAGVVGAAAAGSSCSPRCASRACSTSWSRCGR